MTDDQATAIGYPEARFMVLDRARQPALMLLDAVRTLFIVCSPQRLRVISLTRGR